MIARVYLDTNIFIAAFESVSDPRRYAWQVLDAAEGRLIEVITSELSLAELLSKPPGDDLAVMKQYEMILTSRPGFHVAAVDRAVLVKAAEIRRTIAPMRLPDAIHAATARLTLCTHLLTSDLRLRSVEPAIVRLGPHSLVEITGTAS